MSAPATAGERTCPACGHRLGNMTTGSILDIDDFGDRAATTLNHLFQNEPLVEPCPNCGSRVQALAFVLVKHTSTRFACGYLPEIQGRVAIPGEALEIAWTDDLATFRAALSRHVEQVIGRIVARMARAVDTATRAEVTKTELALANVYGRLIPGLQDTADAFVASHASGVALEALAAPTEVATALDEAIPLVAMTPGVAAHLRPLAGDKDAPPAHGLAAALVLAWQADRRGTEPDQELMASWMMRLLNSLALWERYPEDQRPIIDTGFLRRTLPESMVWAGLATGYTEEERGDLFGVAARAGLLQATDPMRMLRFEGTPAERRAKVLATAEALEVDQPIRAIDLLDAHHLTAEADALIRRRLPGRAREGLGALIAARGMRMYSDLAQPERALELLTLFHQLRPGLDDTQLDPYEAIILAREEGVALRLVGSPIGALDAYKRAEGRLPELDDAEAVASRLWRHMALACCDLGLIPVAKNYAWQAVESSPASDVRAENLETFAACLLREGTFEDVVDVLEEAAALAEGFVYTHPETAAGINQQLAQVQVLLGNDVEAFAAATRAYELAVEVGSEVLQMAFVMAGAGTLRAMLAQRLGRADARALAEEVAPIVHEALARAGDAPGWATTSQVVRARLLSAQGDVAALEAAVQAAPGIALRPLLVEAYVRTGRHGEARAALTRAWDQVFKSVQVQISDDADPVALLRHAQALQGATADLTLADLGTGAITPRDALTGAELQSSIVAGLNAWPRRSLEEAIALVQDPTALLASLGDDVLVVFAVSGARHTVLLCEDGVLASLPAEELRALRAQLSAVTSRAGPRADPLRKSPRWQRFVAEVSAVLEPRLDGLRRVVLSTATSLAGLPLHVVPVRGEPLCQRVPCVYVPGVLTLSRLQRFPPEAPPRRAGVVSVARARDLDAAAEAFAAGAEHARSAAAAAGLEVAALTGREATPDAVRGLLAEVDVAYLSCHGLSQPGRGSHALLLAADGALPPSLVGSAETASGRRHLLEWNAVGSPAPGVVLSAACSSGSATVSSSGERLGLDRAFLRAGTRLFAGPAWDVPIEDAQALAGALLREGIGADWGEAWRAVLTAARGSVSESAWAAFAPIGTWEPFRPASGR